MFIFTNVNAKSFKKEWHSSSGLHPKSVTRDEVLTTLTSPAKRTASPWNKGIGNLLEYWMFGVKLLMPRPTRVKRKPVKLLDSQGDQKTELDPLIVTPNTARKKKQESN